MNACTTLKGLEPPAPRAADGALLYDAFGPPAPWTGARPRTVEEIPPFTPDGAVATHCKRGPRRRADAACRAGARRGSASFPDPRLPPGRGSGPSRPSSSTRSPSTRVPTLTSTSTSTRRRALYGQAPVLPADAIGPKMARLRREHHRMLGNGWCTQPRAALRVRVDLRDLHVLPDQHRVPASRSPLSVTTPSPATKTTASSCSPRCSPASTRTPHDTPRRFA